MLRRFVRVYLVFQFIKLELFFFHIIKLNDLMERKRLKNSSLRFFYFSRNTYVTLIIYLIYILNFLSLWCCSSHQSRFTQVVVFFFVFLDLYIFLFLTFNIWFIRINLFNLIWYRLHVVIIFSCLVSRIL